MATCHMHDHAFCHGYHRVKAPAGLSPEESVILTMPPNYNPNREGGGEGKRKLKRKKEQQEEEKGK